MGRVTSRSRTRWRAIALMTGSRSPCTRKRSVASSCCDLLHAGDVGERGRRHGVAEAHGHVAVGPAAHLRDVLDGDQPALPDDADAVADALDLVEVVRGEEDRRAAVAVLGDDGEELLLHERVQARRRLVEDEQLRLVEERLDEPDLLAVAARELAQRPVEVRLEALGERVRAPACSRRRAGPRRTPAARGRRAGRRRRTRRAGCRGARGSRGCRAGCRGRTAARCRSSGAGGRAACGSSSSCRRRSVPGTRRSRRGAR